MLTYLLMLTRSKRKMANFEDLKAILVGLQEDLKTKATTVKIDELIKIIAEKDAKIDELESKISTLTTTVNLLERKVDDGESHSRRKNLIITGIPTPSRGERENGDDCLRKVKEVLSVLPGLENIDDSFDRAHRVGKKKIGRNDDTTQSMIIRFSTFCSRTSVYKSRKLLNSHRIYLDLSYRRSKLKKLAEDMIKGNDKVNFCFADINCSVCLRLHDGAFKYFNSEAELITILNNLQ